MCRGGQNVFWPAVTALILLALGPIPLSAQWFTQAIPLSPGWNGVQLLVQPVQSDCAVIFSNRPVEKVFWWRRTGTGMEFDLDPALLFPRSADWESWFSGNSGGSSFGNLLAGESYEVYVATNASPFTLHVTGKPVLNATRWLPGALNLTGLPVSTSPAVSFTEFFSFSSDFTVNNATATVFRVSGPNNTPQRIWTPATELIRGGEAYWIAADANVRDYAGPIRVRTGSGSRLLDFGRSVAAQALVVENLTATGRTIQIRHHASEPPPDLPGASALLGKMTLLYKAAAVGSDYQPLPDTLTTNIPAHGSLSLTLIPDPQSLTGGVAGAAWQSVLRVTDGGNAAFPAAAVDVRVGVSCDGSIASQLAPAGLWVGSVSVTDVERAPTREGVTNVWSGDGPMPVGIPYQYRVIVHIDAEGRAKLLQRALLAWRTGSADDASGSLSSVTGVVSVLADETDAENFARQHADARIVRISSVCFPTTLRPVNMTGAFGAPHTLHAVVTLPYDNPVNPFVHRYHPQHDNLRYDNGVASALAEGVESHTITRELVFRFEAVDPVGGIANRNWGTREAGGTFEETVDGLNKTIRARGTFRLERISQVSDLGAPEN